MYLVLLTFCVTVKISVAIVVYGESLDYIEFKKLDDFLHNGINSPQPMLEAEVFMSTLKMFNALMYMLKIIDGDIPEWSHLKSETMNTLQHMRKDGRPLVASDIPNCKFLMEAYKWRHDRIREFRHCMYNIKDAWNFINRRRLSSFN